MSESPKPTQFDEDREAHDVLFAFRQDRLIADDVLAFFAKRVEAVPDAEATDSVTVRNDVLKQLSEGAISLPAAMKVMDGHGELMRAEYAVQYAGTLLDTFASMAQVPTSFEGVMPEALAKVVMGGDPPPVSAALARFTWFCEAEGRVRYIKANAMMQAREL